MKLEVWTEPEPKEDEPTRVRLRKESSGILVLEVVDTKGIRRGCGEIGFVSGDGLCRSPGLDLAFGFTRDDRGRIADI